MQSNNQTINMKDRLLTVALVESEIKSYEGVVGRQTWYGYQSLAKRLREFAGGSVDRVVDEQFFGDFAAYLVRLMQPSSARIFLDRLKTAAKRLLKKGVVRSVPEVTTAEVLPQTGAADRVYLTLGELERLRDTPCRSESVRRAFLFSCYTGLKESEIRNLLWSDIRYSGTGLTLSRPCEGSGGEVAVPLVEPARRLLGILQQEYAALPEARRDGHVFHLQSSTRVAYDIIEWTRKAGIGKQVSYMSARHTFAVTALGGGIDFRTVARWCGFTGVENFQVYAEMAPPPRRTNDERLAAAFA